MPEMNSVIPSLVLNIGNIVVLFVLLRLLVYKPVKKFMSSRAAAVSQQLESAQSQLQEAEALKAQREAELSASAEAAEAEKRRILDAAESHAAEITAAAEAQAEDIRSSAELQAQHAADKLKENAREELADLAVEIASRVLEREVQKGSNQDIIEKYFDRVG